MSFKKITLLLTTDVHSNIWGYNYESNEEMNGCGMANLYTYIKSVKIENPNTLLLDNGDMIQGCILTDDLYNRGWEGSHPISKVMNYMGYEAMTLGNHEFNFGIELLENLKTEVNFPFLSANTTYKDSGEYFVDPYIIIEKSGVKIGVIGLTTPNVPRWVGNKVEKLNFQPLGEAAKREIEKIKNKVDIIVVMAHCSLDEEINYEEDAGRKIIELCPEIDVLMVGHFHITVKNKIGKTLIGGATDKGREIVRFDLTVDENKKIVSREVEIVDMKIYKPSEEIRNIQLIKEAHEKTIELASGKILGKAVSNFQPIDEINWIPQGRLQETPLVQLINKVQLMNSGADVSSTSLIREYSDIKKGNINYGTICGIYKFDTFLFVVEVTGKELKEYMEWTASAYNRWESGDISISFSMDIPGYQHDFFSGINYVIDLSKEVGSRISNLKFKGKPLKDDQIIKLAVSDYCYFTTLIGRNFTSNKPIWKSNQLIKDLLVNYVSKEKIIKPELDKNWFITGVDLSSTYRETIINSVNKGDIDIPYNKSLNIYELKKMGKI